MSDLSEAAYQGMSSFLWLRTFHITVDFLLSHVGVASGLSTFVFDDTVTRFPCVYEFEPQKRKLFGVKQGAPS